jgi:hypothetical protein
MVADFGAAAAELDAFNFGPLHVTGVQVNLSLRRSMRLAYLLRVVKAPTVVRRGGRYRLTLEIQRQNGAKSRRVVTIRVPRGMPVGDRALTLTGTSPDAGVTPSTMGDALTAVLDLGSDDEGEGDEAGVRTVAGLAKRIAAIHRDDGVFAAFPPLGQGSIDPLDEPETPTGAEAVAQKPRVVLNDPQLRIAGTAKRRMLITP